MKFRERFDNVLTGVISGILLPLITVTFIFLFSKGHPPLSAWISRISQANIVTHIVSLSVFSNLLTFMLFNYFDMLKASRGVLAVTIAWAVVVFCIKFFL